MPLPRGCHYHPWVSLSRPQQIQHKLSMRPSLQHSSTLEFPQKPPSRSSPQPPADRPLNTRARVPESFNCGLHRLFRSMLQPILWLSETRLHAHVRHSFMCQAHCLVARAVCFRSFLLRHAVLLIVWSCATHAEDASAEAQEIRVVKNDGWISTQVWANTQSSSAFLKSLVGVLWARRKESSSYVLNANYQSAGRKVNFN